jgi:hypothetical protein
MTMQRTNAEQRTLAPEVTVHYYSTVNHQPTAFSSANVRAAVAITVLPKEIEAT